jgi:hypothetical protein
MTRKLPEAKPSGGAMRYAHLNPCQRYFRFVIVRPFVNPRKLALSSFIALSPPPRLRGGVGLSHRTQLQRYEDGEGGDPQDKGFRPGGRRSFDSWQVGVSIDSLLF